VLNLEDDVNLYFLGSLEYIFMLKMNVFRPCVLKTSKDSYYE